jgi:predicted ATPase
MKLRRLRIENFRQVVFWEHNFTDSLGRVRDLTVLVGPNASGKTSILDAIAAAINPLTRINAIRPGLDLTLKRIVRHGCVFARVEAEVEFSQAELETSLTVLDILRSPEWENEAQAIRDSAVVSIRWTYPDPQGKHHQGRAECTPSAGRSTFRARSRIAQLLATQRIKDFGLLETAGAVFTFDQERALFGRSIPRAVWEILANAGSLPAVPPDEATKPSPPPDRRTSDPRLLLLSMAIQDALPPRNGQEAQPSDFKRIRDAYARVCHPHAIRGAVRDELERFDIEFSNGSTPYRYADLSSGEQMVLLVLIRMVSERIHRSIVLVDEVELHQHPIWQRRLLHGLEKMGIDNQIIATTHSAYLRDVVPPAHVVVLGEVGDLAPEAV